MIGNSLWVDRSGETLGLWFHPAWTGRTRTMYVATAWPRDAWVAVAVSATDARHQSFVVAWREADILIAEFRNAFDGDARRIRIPLPSDAQLLRIAGAEGDGGMRLAALYATPSGVRLLSAYGEVSRDRDVGFGAVTDAWALHCASDGAVYVACVRGGSIMASHCNDETMGVQHTAFVSTVRRTVIESGPVFREDVREHAFTRLTSTPPKDEATPQFLAGRLFPGVAIELGERLPIPPTAAYLRVDAEGPALWRIEMVIQPHLKERRARATLLARLDSGDAMLALGESRQRTQWVSSALRDFDIRDVLLDPIAPCWPVDPGLFVMDRTIAVTRSGLPSPKQVLCTLQRLRPAEIAYAILKPEEAAIAMSLAAYAFITFRGTEADDANDAMRHALWAALLTVALGPEEAASVLANHENPEASDFPEKMDAYNNRVGIRIGTIILGSSNNSALLVPLLIGRIHDEVQSHRQRGLLMHRGNENPDANWARDGRGRSDDQGRGGRDGRGREDPRDGRPHRPSGSPGDHARPEPRSMPRESPDIDFDFCPDPIDPPDRPVGAGLA